jgi:adenine-specific DNA-methyltransferase
LTIVERLLHTISSMRDTTGTYRNRLKEIERQLGSPSYSRPGISIYQGDSLALMGKLNGSPLALTVTSPPYNIGKEYETDRPVEQYLDWCETWIAEIHRLTRRNGALWLNLGYLALPKRAKAIPIPYLLWNRIPFFLNQEIIWSYGAGVASKKTFSPRNEKFLWYVKDPEDYIFNLDEVRDPDVKYPNQKKNGKLKCNPLGKNPTDVWQFPKVTSGTNRKSKERTRHPAQFPIAVIDRIIKACSSPGDIVFDPFIGSGTVAEVALQNRRAVVGIEIEPKYIEIASERLESSFASITYGPDQRELF